jgi:hypothetical protein
MLLGKCFGCADVFPFGTEAIWDQGAAGGSADYVHGYCAAAEGKIAAVVGGAARRQGMVPAAHQFKEG